MKRQSTPRIIAACAMAYGPAFVGQLALAGESYPDPCEETNPPCWCPDYHCGVGDDPSACVAPRCFCNPCSDHECDDMNICVPTTRYVCKRASNPEGSESWDGDMWALEFGIRVWVTDHDVCPVGCPNNDTLDQHWKQHWGGSVDYTKLGTYTLTGSVEQEDPDADWPEWYSDGAPGNVTFTVEVVACSCADNPDGPCGGGGGGESRSIGGAGGSTCDGNFGAGSGNNKSVDVSISLGTGPDGQSAGMLFLKEPLPRDHLVAADSLQLVTSPYTVVHEFTTTSPAIYYKQIKVPQGLAQVVAADRTDGLFTIEFYSNAEAGSPGTGGHYTPGTPFRIWTFSVPGGGVLAEVDDGGTPGAVHDYTYNSSSPRGWTLTQHPHSSSSVVRTIKRTDDAATTNRFETVEIANGSDVVAYHEENHYTNYSWGEAVTHKEVSTDTSHDPLVTEYSYSSSDGSANKPATEMRSDGSWAMHGWGDGRPTGSTSSWLDVTLSDEATAPGQARSTLNSYDPIPGSPEASFINDRYVQPRSQLESITSITVSQTFTTYSFASGTNPDLIEIRERDTDPYTGSGYGDTDNLKTISYYYNKALTGPEADKPHTVLEPDGQLTTYTYTAGGYSPATPDTTPGTFSGSGSYRKTVATHGTSMYPAGIAYKTLQEVSITDPVGHEVLHETNLCTGSSTYVRIDWTVNSYNGEGRLIETHHQNGTFTSRDYDACCGPLSMTDSAGITTNFNTYDPLGRLLQKTRASLGSATGPASESYGGQDALITSYTYDAMGRLLSTMVSDGTHSQTTSQTYDLAGRVLTSTGADGLVTTYDYAIGSGGGQQIIKTLPGSNTPTEITDYYRDGQIKSITGTAVVHSYYLYGVNYNGTRWTCVWRGDGGTSLDPVSWTPSVNGPGTAEWIETTTYDCLGRIKQVERPASGSSTPLTTSYHYNTVGQLDKVTKPGQAATLYAYDALGRVEFTALDVSGNNAIDLASSDRVTKSVDEYEYDSGTSAYYHTTGTIVYTSTATGGDPVTVSTVKERLYPPSSGIAQESYSYDANLNETHTTTTINTTSHLTIQTTDVPDSSTNAVDVSRAGLTLSSTSKTGLRTMYGYDGLMRQTTVTDPRGNATTTAYNSYGQVYTVTDADSHATTYAYNGSSDANSGRLKSQTNALSKAQYFAYTDRGELHRTWGDTTYPVAYIYDDLGRRHTMTTYKGGSGWAGTTWPTPSSSDEETTTWNYEAGTGLLLSKVYADTNQVGYHYTTDGKLDRRTWARQISSSALTTNYGYDANTGELTSIEYKIGTSADPDTPDVFFQYDRLGRQKQIDDGLGRRTFSYRSDLQLDAENIGTLTGDLYSKFITRVYDGTGASDMVPGRAAGLQIGPNSTNFDDDYATFYFFENGGGTDGTGRLSFIQGPGMEGVAYDFAGDSDLVSNVNYFGDGSDALRTHIEYDDHRDLVKSVENIRDPDGTPATLSMYDYANDEIGRRKSVKTTGGAFTGHGGDHHWRWGYNDASELTDADRCTTTTLTGSCTHVTGPPNQYQYEYDPIGNRADSTEGTASAKYYCANNLNQYTATAAASGCSTPTESFTYDDDGNLTQDGTFNYTWDAENRLIAVAPDLPANGDKRVEFLYDYMSRRIQKQVYHWASASWVLDSDQRFVYDGWNVVLVLDGSNDVLTRYAWGLDLSGQRGDPSASGIHGAGGIGGLLAAEEPSLSGTPSYWFTYDANGNVGQIVVNDTATTQDYDIAGHYEYDAYGNAIVSDDTDSSNYVNVNPFRFSTKWRDEETGLVYYGYRYYKPAIGGWLNRDPMTEAGGLNLYQFVLSSPTNYIDLSGLQASGPVTQPQVSIEPFTAVYYSSLDLDYTFNATIEFDKNPEWKAGGYVVQHNSSKFSAYNMSGVFLQTKSQIDDLSTYAHFIKDSVDNKSQHQPLEDSSTQVCKTMFSMSSSMAVYSGAKVKSRTGPATGGWGVYDSFRDKEGQIGQTAQTKLNGEWLKKDDNAKEPGINEGLFARGTGQASASLNREVTIEVDPIKKTMKISIVWTLPRGVKGKKININYNGPFPVDEVKLEQSRSDVN